MSKTFYTERDVQDLVANNVSTLQLDDNIVLTMLAKDTAAKLGLELIYDSPDAEAAPHRARMKWPKNGAPNGRTSSAAKLLQRRVRLLGEKAPLFYDEPVHLVRGEGVWLYDADGKRYLDVYNNVPSVGHCHPHIVAAIIRQAQTLNTHTRYLHEAIIEYGERLTATLDETLSKAYFVCTGSEANELALRIARQHTGGMGIIGSNASYHGNTAALFDLDTFFSPGVSMSPYIQTVPFPETYRPLHSLSGTALADAYVAEGKSVV